MTFEDWWEQPVEGSKVSKEQMRSDIIKSMKTTGTDFIDLKIALQDAYSEGYAEGWKRGWDDSRGF